MVNPGVWFPAIKTGTGTDTFTRRLCEGIADRGIRAAIEWLPPRAEYLPWSVAAPLPPAWASIVHVNTWLHRRFIPTNLPVVATMHLCVHDASLDPYKEWPKRAYHRLWVRPLEDSVLKRADRVTAVSEYTSDRTRETFSLPDVEVIYNGVEIPESYRIRSASGRPFRLLYVGNWLRRKGVDLLGPVMNLLGDDFELLYTADSKASRLRDDLPGNCRCIGRLSPSELAHAYLDADALLFPSRLEGLPLAVIEAMATGLPVVTVRSSSLPEVVLDGISGVLCDVDDVSGLASAIRLLSGDEGLMRKLSTGARQRAAEVFSLETMVGKYEQLYRNLLEKR